MTTRRRGLRILLLALLCLALASTGFAQTIERRSQFDLFPERIEVADPPAWILAQNGMRSAAERIAKIWPRIASEVAAELGVDAPAPVAVYLMRGRDFERWSRGLLPDWGIGYANWPDGPIALNIDAITAGHKPLEFVLRHEVSHVYLGQATRGARPPTWFVEGVAQIQASEWGLGDTMALVQVASIGELPVLSDLQNRFPVGGRAAEMAYRLSVLAVQDIDRRLKDRGGWPVIVAAMREDGSFDTAFEREMGIRIAEFEADLASKLRVRYGWIAAVGSATTLFLLMTLLFLAGSARAHLRKRRRLKEMELEERDLVEG